MKFEKNGMKFEVSHLDHIVINNVRRIIKPAEVTDKGVKPARVTSKYERANGDKGTRVWIKFDFANEQIRWLKYHDVVTSAAIGLDPKAAQGYASHAEIRDLIDQAMHNPAMHVWFSGTYCNIEICDNWQEVQRIRAQEEARKRKARQPKIPRKGDVMDALRYAISSAGAQVRQESISTPFGPIPVMTIQGSGKRDLLRDMEAIGKTGTFVSLDEAAQHLGIKRKG